MTKFCHCAFLVFVLLVLSTVSRASTPVTLTSDGDVWLHATISGYTQAQWPDSISIDLYDSNATTLLFSFSFSPEPSNTSTTDSVIITGLAAGTYYAVITAPFAYTFSYNLVSSPIANDNEPDNAPLQAISLPLNATAQGHLGFYYNQQIDTIDWYKINTSVDGDLYLLFTNYSNYNEGGVTSIGLDAGITLFDENGTHVLNNFIVEFNPLGIGTSNYTFLGLSPGTYYVKVDTRVTATTVYNYRRMPYTLYDSLITSAYANDAESDDSPVQALTLHLDTTMQGHLDYYNNKHVDTIDWYKLNTDSDGNVLITLINYSQQLYNTFKDLSATLYDENGTHLIAGVQTAGGFGYSSNNITIGGLAAGTYYLAVETINTSDTIYGAYPAPYSINVQLVNKPTLNNDTELNDAPQNADAFAINSSTTGHIGYYYNLHTDTVDWFKFNLLSDGDLILNAGLAWGDAAYAPNPQVTFTLFDSTATVSQGNFPLLMNFGGSSSDSKTFTGLKKGNYYLQVNLTGGGYFWYNLQDSLIAQPAGIEAAPLTDNYFLVYPNPFGSFTTIHADKILNGASLTVYNSLGQQVKQIINITGQTITLQRDNLPSGLYFIRVAQDNRIFTTEKLIITDN